MKFVIREMSWFKRRDPVPEPKPISVKVEGFELVREHMCKMVVTYDDGNVHVLIGRVTQNEITKDWHVYGLDSKGHSAYCDIEDI